MIDFQQEREEIISRLTIYDVYGDEGLKRVSKSFVMKCPLPDHIEKTPSFHVYDGNLSFHCFGCGESGSIFDFIMKRDRVSFIEALKFLADKAGVDISTGNGNGNGRFARLHRLNDEAVAIFQENLRTSDVATKWFKDVRQLTKESMERFKVGVTGPMLKKTLLARGYTEEEMESVGLITKTEETGTYRDVWIRRIMIPITSIGKVKAFGGRIWIKQDIEAEVMGKYKNSPNTLLFDKSTMLFGVDGQAIKDMGYAIVVEGYLDLIMLHQHGFRNAVATCGTALTKEHVEILRKYTDFIYLVYDGDNAGSKASEKSTLLLFRQWMRGRVVTMPEKEDPDSFLRKDGDFNALLNTGIPFGVYLAQKFPGTKLEVFRGLLRREDQYDTIGFLGYCGTAPEMRMFAEFEARTVVEKMLRNAPVIVSENDIEVKQWEDQLYLFKNKCFLLHQKVEGDCLKQAQKMATMLARLRATVLTKRKRAQPPAKRR